MATREEFEGEDGRKCYEITAHLYMVVCADDAVKALNHADKVLVANAAAYDSVWHEVDYCFTADVKPLDAEGVAVHVCDTGFPVHHNHD